MKVCLVAEGCYPYVRGGVSSWVHSIINLFPDIEFYLVAIVSDRGVRGKFLYELPPNLVEVREVYLQDEDWDRPRGTPDNLSFRLDAAGEAALRSLVRGTAVDWAGIFDLFCGPSFSIDTLLMSPLFYDLVREYYEETYPYVTFSDFLWTLRSIYLPLFTALKGSAPACDIYHCVATGYAGIIGAQAKHLHPGSRLLISEHGIYTREREEEIIKGKWVKGIYKDVWIEQFRKMSTCAYENADLVTSLFENARRLQVELGCPPQKTQVTPNGIDGSAFENIPGKDPADPTVHIGAFLRVTPIKDVKTMISAFYYAHRQMPGMKLWILGPDDEDREYARECRQLITLLGATDIEFTGHIRTTEYIGRMDMTLLTSISEGQPLTIIESFAAKKPAIATNVGNCQGLIYGEADNFGPAGMVVSVLNISEISNAILALAQDAQARQRMGEAGYKRFMHRYRSQHMQDTYQKIYADLSPGSPGAKRGD